MKTQIEERMHKIEDLLRWLYRLDVRDWDAAKMRVVKLHLEALIDLREAMETRADGDGA